MSCCTTAINLCIAQGNTKGYLFTARDQAGDLLDISDVQEITFAIASKSSGETLLVKSLTGGGIIINNTSQFSATITAAESANFPVGSLYCEVGIVSANGGKYTLGAGLFEVTDTIIWDS